MHDPFGLLIASVNVVLAFLILVLEAWGVNYFKEGLLVKTLKRGMITGGLLFLFFLTEALIAVDVLPANTPINEVLGPLFMLSLVYTAYKFTRDWQKFQPG